jgi:hypothetical protein
MSSSGLKDDPQLEWLLGQWPDALQPTALERHLAAKVQRPHTTHKGLLRLPCARP